MITGLELVKKLYSSGDCNIYIIQKEFGIKQSLINYLRDSIDSSRIKKMGLEETKRKLEKSIPKNKFLRNKLVREAISSKSAVINGPKNNTRDISNRKVKDKLIKDIVSSNNHSPRDKKKLTNLINDRDRLISFNESEGGNASLAHEIGHVKASRDKLTGKFHKKSEKFREGFNNSSLPERTEGYFEDGSSSISEGISRYFKGKAIVMNERIASKRAIKLLKNKGASKEEVSRAKNLLDNDLESYKEDVNAYWKIPIRNRLEGKKSRIIDKTKEKTSLTNIPKVDKTKERLMKKKRLEEKRKLNQNIEKL